ncbi:MAG: hypothetical protein Q7R56_01120 [Nanoarchaeota archaeon]|nr:hypothetical protein [Nanoarchaeota archaeon]
MTARLQSLGNDQYCVEGLGIIDNPSEDDFNAKRSRICEVLCYAATNSLGELLQGTNGAMHSDGYEGVGFDKNGREVTIIAPVQGKVGRGKVEIVAGSQVLNEQLHPSVSLNVERSIEGKTEEYDFLRRIPGWLETLPQRMDTALDSLVSEGYQRTQRGPQAL